MVYAINDHALQIFFIKSGEIILYNEHDKPFKKYIEGEMFGDSDVLLDLERDGNAIIASSTATLLVINKEDLDKLFVNDQQMQYQMTNDATAK